MSLAELVLLVILVIGLGQILRGKWRIDVAALFMLVTLGAAQYLGLSIVSEDGAKSVLTVFSGFDQPMIFTLIGLFILTRALYQQGVLDWLADRVVHLAGGSTPRLIVLFSGLAILLSLFMNNIAVGALLLPGALQAARKTGTPPGRLLMPIAFATSLGGMSTYFTTANIVMSELLTSAQPPQAALNVLAFTPTGGLIALFGLLYMAWLGPRLLPQRPASHEQNLAQQTSEQLVKRYHLRERLWEAQILDDSPLAGKTLAQAKLGEGLGLSVIAIWRGREALLRLEADSELRAGDILLLIGRADRVAQLQDWGCRIGRKDHACDEAGLALVEIMPSPHAPHLLGKTLQQDNFRRNYGFTAVALLRRGQSFRTDVGNFPLQTGDTLLVVGPRAGLARLRHSEDWLILGEAPPLRSITWRSWASILLFVAVVGLSIFGVPVYLATMSMAFISLLLQLTPLEDLYRTIDWQVIFFLAGMYALGLGMVQTGLVEQIGALVMHALPAPTPMLLGTVAFWLAAILTQFMGSQATAFVVGPLLVAAAIHAQINPQAIAVAAAIGCSASFLTPMSHPVNLIMVTPGNYRFGDFPRLGFGLLLITFGGLLLGLRLFWGFY